MIGLVGQVTSNADPSQMGRIKCALAALDGQELPEWIEPVWPAGLCDVPEPQDEVWIVAPSLDDLAEHADEVRYMGLADGTARVPSEFRAGYPRRRGWRSRKGHILLADDATGDLWLRRSGAADELHFGSTGVATLLAAIKAHIKAPLVDLANVATDQVVKGTTFNGALTPLLTAASAFLAQQDTIAQAWKSAAEGGNPWSPTLGQVNSYRAALAALTSAVATFAGAMVGWLSLKVRTG